MRALLLLLPSFLFSAFFGCIDEPSQNNMFSVSGQVVDRNGFPCPNVEISEYKIYSSISDEKGFFNLNGIFPPYNLSFTGQEISGHNYIGLKKSQTIISLDWYSEYIQNRALVEVGFPQLGQGRRLYLKFISDKFYFQPLNGYAVEGQRSCIFDIFINKDESFISGKLLYLEYYTKEWNLENPIMDI